MGLPQKITKFERNFSPSDIRWGSVIDSLMNRFELPFLMADNATRSFHRRVSMFFPIYWFLRGQLNQTDNQIVLAICETMSVDTFTLRSASRLLVGVVPVEYSHELFFEPGLRNKDGKQLKGRCYPKVSLGMLRRKREFTSPLLALTIHILLVLCAILTYLIFVEALLYGLTVFILLLRHPDAIASAASRHASLGFGLIFFFLGFFGLFGGTVKLLWREWRKFKK